MLCDQILGNIFTRNQEWGELDHVELSWDDCSKRALRKTTRAGHDLRIVLPPGVRLQHGDVLMAKSPGCVVVEVLPCDVLIAKPAGVREMGLLAIELGNLHAPVEVHAEHLIVLPDGPVEVLLTRYGIAYERASRRFAPMRVDVAPHLRLAENFRVRPA